MALLTTIAAGATIASVGSSLLGGVFGASAARREARATAAALREEKEFNLGVLREQKIDQYWADQMNMWRRGMAIGVGTSARGVVESNQAVLGRNIEFQESQYNRKIANANAAAGRRFMGIF